MREAAIVFTAMFALVFIRAFQQRNVAHLHYRAIMPTSFAFAILDIVVITEVVKQGMTAELVVPMALGGGLGCMTSMKVHETYMKEKK